MVSISGQLRRNRNIVTPSRGALPPVLRAKDAQEDEPQHRIHLPDDIIDGAVSSVYQSEPLHAEIPRLFINSLSPGID